MHISAGALVRRKQPKGVEVLIMYRSKTDTYHLPKGTQENGESLEDTAIREIKEETGCDIALKTKLLSLESFFERNGEHIYKQTYYFIADYIGGSLSSHDKEHDQVFFIPLNEAKILLRERGGYLLGYENELEVLECFEKIFISRN